MIFDRNEVKKVDEKWMIQQISATNYRIDRVKRIAETAVCLSGAAVVFIAMQIISALL